MCLQVELRATPASVLCVSRSVSQSWFLFPSGAGKVGQWAAEQMEQQCLPFPRLEWLHLQPMGARRPHNEAVEARGGGGGEWLRANALQHPVSPRHAYSTCTTTHTHTQRHTHTHTHTHTVSKGFPCVADESTRGGRPNNGATQWEAGEGSCSVRAGAITARGSNREHLAAELHSQTPLFVPGWGGWKGVNAERKGRGRLKEQRGL